MLFWRDDTFLIIRDCWLVGTFGVFGFWKEKGFPKNLFIALTLDIISHANIYIFVNNFHCFCHANNFLKKGADYLLIYYSNNYTMFSWNKIKLKIFYLPILLWIFWPNVSKYWNFVKIKVIKPNHFETKPLLHLSVTQPAIFSHKF